MDSLRRLHYKRRAASAGVSASTENMLLTRRDRLSNEAALERVRTLLGIGATVLAIPCSC